MMHQKVVALACASLLALACTGCAGTPSTTDQSAASQSADKSGASASSSSNSQAASFTPAAATWQSTLAAIDMSSWQYNAEDDVYWQVGVSYCATPVDANYETLGVFVPGAYFTATDNGDGTYTCAINEQASVASYTAQTAPIVFPVNTPGHKAQDAPTGYERGCASYTSQGYVYVEAGCRGKDAGVPAGVTDLKAAIRYIRLCDASLPGNSDRIVVYGMSGGGSQCATLGASGDSDLYYPYLAQLGAATTSDAVAAAMCWCPITSYDTSDLAYEWNMGSTRSDLDEQMQAISNGLAQAYANYVNQMGFTDSSGNKLTLEQSAEGIYQAGSYYDYVKAVIEQSLANYLTDTSFPTSGKSGSYDSPEAYVASLNSDGEWVSYDAATGNVTITSIAAFAQHCKNATKPIAAFDKLEQGGHELFNTGDGEKTHYDSVLYELVKGTQYEQEMADDLAKTDALGNNMSYRINMFSPLYYLMSANEGYNSSNVAQNWRIRTGIEQTDTALTTEVNLALALNMRGANVDFETVWGQGHTQAERTGDSGENFINWVNSLWS
ncbi:MAG: hypothetical protein Q4B54_10435 [Coriobacteriales bacterium]|nr:hypothetical protein [Coriobacteriales bacterium]